MANKKYFVFDSGERLTKEEKEKIRVQDELLANKLYTQQRESDIKKLSEEDGLRHVDGKVVIKIDLDGKDSWTFESGLKIEYRRRFDNLNQREVSPVNAIVISGEGIIKNSEILIHPNAIHDSSRIFDYKDSNDRIRYYSIHSDMCFAWHDGKEWLPLEPYDFALRIFEPYKGFLIGIEPKQLPDTLYVTTGKLKGTVVKTLKACDYEIVFMDKNGREGNLIRFRPFGDKKNKREEEAIAGLHYLTDKVNKGELLVGREVKDAKPLNELTNA